jgi:hypothetical protein
MLNLRMTFYATLDDSQFSISQRHSSDKAAQRFSTRQRQFFSTLYDSVQSRATDSCASSHLRGSQTAESKASETQPEDETTLHSQQRSKISVMAEKKSPAEAYRRAVMEYAKTQSKTAESIAKPTETMTNLSATSSRAGVQQITTAAELHSALTAAKAAGLTTSSKRALKL